MPYMPQNIHPKTISNLYWQSKILKPNFLINKKLFVVSTYHL